MLYKITLYSLITPLLLLGFRAAVKPLKGKHVAFVGKLSAVQSEVKTVVEKLGGSVTTSLKKAHFCISTKGDLLQQVQVLLFVSAAL